MWTIRIFTVVFCFYTLTSAINEPNEDIITVLNHVISELKDLKTHVQQQDRKENATERVLELLKTQNEEIRSDLKELKKEVKDQESYTKSTLTELKKDIHRIREDNEHVRKDVGDVKKDVEKVKQNVKDVGQAVERVKKMEDDVEIVKNILTKPLPGKTLKNPSESCQWLNEHFYTLHDGHYWTKKNGKLTYEHCTMDEAGIPVRCSTNPCHPNAVCQDVEFGVKCTCNCGYIGDGKQCKKSFLPRKIGKGMMLVTNTCAPKQNTLLTTFKTMSKEYLVRFELYALVHSINWTNLVHFTTGENCCEVGQRIPGVWFNGGNNLPDKLLLVSYLNDVGDFNKCDNDTVTLLHQWTQVEIMQKKNEKNQYIYSITLNQQQIVSVVNWKPQDFSYVRLYLSDPWHYSHPGYIRNFYVEGYA